MPEYLVFDSALSFDLETVSPDLEGARLELNATNLLDKEYVSTCYSKNACFFGGRRNIQATIRYRW